MTVQNEDWHTRNRANAKHMQVSQCCIGNEKKIESFKACNYHIVELRGANQLSDDLHSRLIRESNGVTNIRLKKAHIRKF